jgi:ABC-2 type transport system ATP-binding protein
MSRPTLTRSLTSQPFRSHFTIPSTVGGGLLKVHGRLILRGRRGFIEQGDFFALLGPNGAGKSTLISILTNLVTKTSGEVRIFDVSIDTNPTLAKTYIGLVPQEFNFNIFEKVIDIVVTQAGYYGIPRPEALTRAEAILKALGLWDKRNEPSQNSLVV